MDIIGPEDSENVVARGLDAIARRSKIQNRVNRVLGIVWLGWAAVLIACMLIDEDRFHRLWLSTYLVYAFVGISYLVGRVFLKSRAIHALADCNDIRAVIPLMDIAFGFDSRYYDGATKQAALCALARLLPNVPRDHAFTAVHVKTLRNILKMDGYILFGKYQPPGMVLASLKCLLAIGDIEILDSVERLSKKANEPEVRAAALAALPTLRAQIPSRRQTDTLLRPASCEDSSLLRAASGAPSDEQTLLQASDKPS